MPDHVDATVIWIAVALLDDGHDADWVRMVVREKGHGDIDLDQARQWLAANPDGMCRCADCRPDRPSRTSRRTAPVQLTLI